MFLNCPKNTIVIKKLANLLINHTPFMTVIISQVKAGLSCSCLLPDNSGINRVGT